MLTTSFFYELPNYRIYLDKPIPKLYKNTSFSFLSHAHSDHTFSLKSNKYITSKQTYCFLSQDPNNFLQTALPEIKLYNAGHILGSRQIQISDETTGDVFCYTGDIKLEENIFGEKAEIPECQTLLIESTYADPSKKIPTKQDVYSDISNFLDRKLENSLLLFGAYSLGKAQELIKLLNSQGLIPVVDEKIAYFSEKYVKNGIKLDFLDVRSQQAKEVLQSGDFIAILPPNKINRLLIRNLSFAYNKKIISSMLTARIDDYKYKYDIIFPLSDHADLSELLYYISTSGAKKIYTTHGEAEKFANFLNKQGYDAKVYSQPNSFKN